VIRRGILAGLAAGLLIAAAGYVTEVQAASRVARFAPAARTGAAAAPSSEPTSAAPATIPSPAPAPTPVPRSGDSLQAVVDALAGSSGARVAVALVELGGARPLSWSYDGERRFTAASTYKLPLLMEEAQRLASGSVRPTDQLCYTDVEWEDGWYGDYADGACFSRQELARRAAQQSDNTAAHILVDAFGGGPALNAYARAHGATGSQFYDPNTTTAGDLARLWVDEARGGAGGPAAQQWLYPLLTHTSFEAGIPAGAGPGATVVHKVGMLDGEVNDAALVLGGPQGDYVLVVLTDGPGGDAGWRLVASVSSAVWQFESARPPV